MKEPEKTLIFINTLLQVICCSFILMLFPNAVKGEMKNHLNINMNSVKDQADVVIVGTLEPVPPPFEVLGYRFYKIHSEEIMKGSFLSENNLLAFRLLFSTSEGSIPAIDTGSSYILFLKQIEIEDNSRNIPNYTFYKTIENWKGIISLEENSKERRAVQNINKNYGINIFDDVSSFKRALKYSLSIDATEELSNSADKIYNILKLKRK